MEKIAVSYKPVLLFIAIGLMWQGNSFAVPAVPTDSTSSIHGITGKISETTFIMPASDCTKTLADLHAPTDIDLKRMAEWSLYYLTNSPRKNFNYDPVFQCFPYQCPPAPDRADPIVPCDTDARMEWEWYYMRDITGSKMGKDVEIEFHKRMMRYVDSEGFVWSDPGCYNEAATDAVYSEKDRVIHIWGATKILKSLSEDYIRTKNPESKALAYKIMQGLKRLSTWDDKGRCWIASGMGGMRPDGTVAISSAQPAPLVESLITFWQATRDKEALDFAKAYAEGIIDNLQPGCIVFQRDGSFGDGHGHITMHALWGVAHLGLVTGNMRYIQFAKRSWDWMLSRGTGTGWFPAAPLWANDCAEVCCLSDMMSIASCIAQAGYPEYYDYIERYMRNYIANLQFIATPEYEKRYRELNKAQSKEKVENGLSEAKNFQGGFYNAGLNDFENAILGGGGYVWKIAGCCAPEGMRAVYTTWTNTIAKMPKTALGQAGVYVNMCFNRDSEWGKVVSFMPQEGRITVKAKVSDIFFLRPPHWTSPSQIRTYINGMPVYTQWSGAYVRFAAKSGDELTITYPLVRFRQDVAGLWPMKAPELKMSFEWLGNMVISATPSAGSEQTPLFTGKVKVTPPAPKQ